MGSEVSKKNSRERDDPVSAEIARALENQRIMYEIQYEELRSGYLQNQANTTNRNQLNRNNQSVNSPRTPLYPNLSNVVNNNTQTTAVSSRQSTSLMPGSPNVPGTSYSTTTSCGPAPLYRPQPSAPQIPSAPPLPSASPARLTTEIKRQTSLPVPKLPSSNTPRNIPPKKNGQSIVDCVTCKNELYEQIYQCKNGHSSCKECRLKKAQCGVCCEFITAMRNITLEATLADIKPTTIKPTTTTTKSPMMRCPHEGCKASINKNFIEKHFKECPFKEISCASIEISGRCPWKGKLNQLVDHFNEFHQDHREAEVDKEMSLTNITEDKNIVYLVNMGKFNFLLHVQINSSQETVSMVVQLIGTKNVASKWSYEIHIYNKKDNWKKYQYTDTCHSHAESVKEIIDSKNCAVLSTKYAKNFLHNKQLFYKFYIKMDDIGRTNNRPN